MARSRSIFGAEGLGLRPVLRACSSPPDLRRLSGQVAASFLDLLFPPACADCDAGLEPGTAAPLLCHDCRSRWTDRQPDSRCRGCGLPTASVGRFACASCRRGHFRFHEVVALGCYRGALRQAVIRMKQFHEYPLAAAAGILLARRVAEQLEGRLPHVAVPIPKYWLKRLWRGTNTAEVLADRVASYLQIPSRPGAIWCRRSTHKQSLLSPSERRRNVRGAFAVASGYDFRGAHVLVVDDTLTTGATASEAARALRQAGTARVTVAVVGRAPLP